MSRSLPSVKTKATVPKSAEPLPALIISPPGLSLGLSA